MEMKPPSTRGDGRLTEVAENSDEGSERGTLAKQTLITRRTSIVSRASEKGLSTKDKSKNL